MPRKTKTKSKAKKPRKQKGGSFDLPNAIPNAIMSALRLLAPLRGKGKKKTGRGIMKLPKFIDPLMPPPFVMM